jgi:hypothetical protein
MWFVTYIYSGFGSGLNPILMARYPKAEFLIKIS